MVNFTIFLSIPQALDLWNKGGICQLHKACKSYLYLTNCILLMCLKIEEGGLSQLLFLSVEFTGKKELERAKYS